ncbi:MAG: hypothetical protein LBH96_05060 [Candidatus Peribacteria bacterium]|jgi:uncharacterized protein involved in copper resistance|nr:hypothetical protein [Candidatus Peribacteria bacterium]
MKFPNQKNTDQKNSIMLMLYALQQLNTQLAEEDLKEPLQIETQVLMFQGNQHVETIKERNTNINMKEAIETSEALNYANGGDTNAYDAISQYYQQISQPRKKQTTDEYQDRKEKVKKGEIKEILFILSDGSFNTGDDRKAKTLVTKLREMGIIVCGI